MKTLLRCVPLALVLVMAGCAGTSSKQQILASGSQVEIRSYQTRTYDTNNKTRVLRAVMSTLQDLGFVIDKADDIAGVVSATKLQGYALSMSVSVRPKGQQMTVRANAQFNLRAVEDPGPYQDFFTSLDKGLFLDDNLLTDSVEVHIPTANETPTAAAMTTIDPGVYDYYGEAEKEIVSASYDPNLWARALVLAEGNEQKRKAKYIEIRAEQLYQQNTKSTTNVKKINPIAIKSTSVVKVQPKPANVLSGRYRSDISSDATWTFKKNEHRSLIITFQQNGNEITGTNSSVDLKINGIRDGDEITFYTLPSHITSYEIKGKWTVSADGRKLVGKWSVPNGGGRWDLTRL